MSHLPASFFPGKINDEREFIKQQKCGGSPRLNAIRHIDHREKKEWHREPWRTAEQAVHYDESKDIITEAVVWIRKVNQFKPKACQDEFREWVQVAVFQQYYF